MVAEELQDVDDLHLQHLEVEQKVYRTWCKSTSVIF